jgi:hypothetical protein
MNGVSGLDKELAELKEFIAELKADRAKQKEKEAREAWTKYTSLSLVFIAVLAAIANQWAGKYSSAVLVQLNNSTLYQAQASDQWSFYQAKSIKQNLYEGLRDLAPNAAVVGNNTPSLEAFNAKVAKYEAEKKDVMAEAKKLEAQQKASREAANNASHHGGGMGKAISTFQIAIALASICLVTKKRPLWYVSLVLTAVATAQMVSVWLS